MSKLIVAAFLLGLFTFGCGKTEEQPTTPTSPTAPVTAPEAPSAGSTVAE